MDDKNWEQNLFNIIQEYLKRCEDKKELPTVQGLAVYGNFSTDYLEDKSRESDIVSGAYKKLKAIQANEIIQNAIKRKWDPNFSRFLLSANHGMKETTATENKNDDKIEIEFVEEKKDKPLEDKDKPIKS